MRFIITEGQYKLLLEELDDKPKVYTSKTEYDKAMIVYNRQLMFYKYTVALASIKDSEIKTKCSFTLSSNLEKELLDSEINEWKQFFEIFSSISNLPEITNILEIFEQFSIANMQMVKKQIDATVEDKYRKSFFKLLENRKLEVFTFLGLKILKENKKLFKKVFGEMKIKKWVPFIKRICLDTKRFDDWFSSIPVVDKPIEPIYQPPNSEVPINKTILTPKKEEPKVIPPVETNFSVTWREELPSGKVEQNIHYFNSYEEWEKFINQYDRYISKNENKSKTKAEALYGGKLNLSKDKTN